ncbi:MAG TPA: hypothetical protein VLV28_08855, partial [Gaiellaceae bacterium]|nr:hypothetical protein [Gaiellaceae bacterium]
MKGITAALVVLVALVAAPAALAWTPNLTASMDCNGVVSYTVTADSQDASRTNSDIAIFDDAALTNQVATGAFSSANNWSFSGTFTEPTSLTTVTV